MAEMWRQMRDLAEWDGLPEAEAAYKDIDDKTLMAMARDPKLAIGTKKGRQDGTRPTAGKLADYRLFVSMVHEFDEIVKNWDEWGPLIEERDAIAETIRTLEGTERQRRLDRAVEIDVELLRRRARRDNLPEVDRTCRPGSNGKSSREHEGSS